MPAAETPVACLGIDVGKSSHSACALDAGGGVAFRAELANRPDDIDRLLERAGSGALVVVDQKRNIGALVLARAHAHGNPCAYLPGYAEKQARGMFPGIAKTDAIDAEVIARTALGVPRALRPAPEEPEGTASLRILSSQREFASSARTRAKNRLRAGPARGRPRARGRGRPVEPLAGVDAGRVRRGRRVLGRRLAQVLERRQARGRPRGGGQEALGGAAGLVALGKAAPGRRGRRGPDTRPGDSLPRRRHRGTRLARGRLAGGRRGLRVPPHGARDRPQDRRGAGDVDRHIRVQGARRARELLRRGAVRQALREQHQVDVAAARREQAAQEPAHIQLQLPHRHGQQVREVLRGVQGEGDEAQQGAEGGREEEAQGHLRDHARRRPVRGLAGGGINQRGNRAGAPGARMRHAEMARSTRLTKP